MQHLHMTAELNQKEIVEIGRRYHFQTSDLTMLENLYAVMCPLLDVQAWYLVDPQLPNIEFSHYVAAYMTLGEGVDALQDVYLNRNHVSEAYMIECIALELLSRSYEAFAKEVQLQTGMYAVRIHFLGDRYPFSLIDEINGQMPDTGVSFNAEYSMTPQKSVALLLELQDSRQPESHIVDAAQVKHRADAMCHVRLAHICADCPNTDCEYRQRENYTYGYQRIFGRGRMPDRKKGE